MEDVHFEIVSGEGVVVACGAALSGPRTSMFVVISFTGDRVSCCDEAVVAKRGGKIVGVATLAPDGEVGGGRPTLVGIWVDPASSRSGIGSRLVELVVARVVERGLPLPVRVDAVEASLAEWFRRRRGADRLDVRCF